MKPNKAVADIVVDPSKKLFRNAFQTDNIPLFIQVTTINNERRISYCSYKLLLCRWASEWCFWGEFASKNLLLKKRKIWNLSLLFSDWYNIKLCTLSIPSFWSWFRCSSLHNIFHIVTERLGSLLARRSINRRKWIDLLSKNSVCSICLDNIDEEDEFLVEDCNHKFIMVIMTTSSRFFN